MCLLVDATFEKIRYEVGKILIQTGNSMPIACKLNKWIQSRFQGFFFSRPTDFYALRLNREVNTSATSLIKIELSLDRLLVRLEAKSSLCLQLHSKLIAFSYRYVTRGVYRVYDLADVIYFHVYALWWMFYWFLYTAF